VDLGLVGKRALVTGASGGIGQAVARELAAEGVEVVAHYHRNAEPARALGGLALGADLRDEAQVEALFLQAGPLDLCVANAGVWPSEDVPVAELPLERWRATIEGNLTATFLTARGFARGIRSHPPGRGALVLIGSTAGRFGEAGHADYAAAKAAIGQGLLLSLKNELAPARVNVVAPGWTVSPMTEASLTDELVETVTATMALKQVARTEDIARTVVWLCSERAAGHVTGEVVTVAGGMEGRLLARRGA
jgi:3-oxoacyl-[acyl-carrier protein] reductase